MNSFKRAITNIRRTFGKTVLLLLLVFILSSFIMGAISIRSAINSTEANLHRNIPTIVTIHQDIDAWSESIDWSDVDFFDHANIPRMEALTMSHVQEFGALPYVEHVEFATGGTLSSRKLVNFPPNSNEEWEPKFFEINGASRAEILQFEHGLMNLIQGRLFEESDFISGQSKSVAIISEDLANENNLSIGSTIELYELIPFPNESGNFHHNEAYFSDDNNLKIGMEFEIIGLFERPLEEGQYPWDSWALESQFNSIFVPIWAMENLFSQIAEARLSVWDLVDFDPPEWIFNEVIMETDYASSVFFLLKDSNYINSFNLAVEPYLPSEFHYVIDLTSRYANIRSAMGMLQEIANGVLITAIVATILILVLLLTLFLRDRRGEIGIYLALGEKKKSIISQILMEIMVISIVSITLAVFAGRFISNEFSQNMLRNELTALAQDVDLLQAWGEWSPFDAIAMQTSAMSVEEMMEVFDTSLSSATIVLFYAISLGTIIISTVIPVWFVVKLSPKEVLI